MNTVFSKLKHVIPRTSIFNKMQLSLVAYYGKKPPVLLNLIVDLQALLQDRLGRAFRPYTIEQVHATLIGLELFEAEQKLYSVWYRRNIGSPMPVDFRGLMQQLQAEWPDFQIRIGGYEPNGRYGFRSRGDHPYTRTFSFQINAAVVVGWPVVSTGKGRNYQESFYELRRSFERYQFCHKWHKDGYRDNDCYLVLGKIDPDRVSPLCRAELSREIREILSGAPVYIPFERDLLSMVIYEDAELPPSSTHLFPLTELGTDPTAFLKVLNIS